MTYKLLYYLAAVLILMMFALVVYQNYTLFMK